jgi:hypothetical protein
LCAEAASVARAISLGRFGAERHTDFDAAPDLARQIPETQRRTTTRTLRRARPSLPDESRSDGDQDGNSIESSRWRDVADFAARDLPRRLRDRERNRAQPTSA